jgi:hypothetical protein
MAKIRELSEKNESQKDSESKDIHQQVPPEGLGDILYPGAFLPFQVADLPLLAYPDQSFIDSRRHRELPPFCAHATL